MGANNSTETKVPRSQWQHDGRFHSHTTEFEREFFNCERGDCEEVPEENHPHDIPVSTSEQPKPRQKLKHQVVASAAVGMLTNVRKRLLHQLVNRKASTLRSAVGQKTSALVIPRKFMPSPKLEQQHVETQVQSEQRPASGGTRKTTSSFFHQEAGSTDCNNFDDSSQLSSARAAPNGNRTHDGLNHSLSKGEHKSGDPKRSATKTHVRIRISCSDNAGDGWRSDVSTQTDAAAKAGHHSSIGSAIYGSESSTESGYSSGGTWSKENLKPRYLPNLKKKDKTSQQRVVDKDTDSPKSPMSSGSKSLSSTVSGKSCKAASHNNSSNAKGGVITRRTTIQASTGELLDSLGHFIKNHFGHIPGVSNQTVISWMRAIDRSLTSQGWQDTPFISPGTIVMVYMLLRDSRMPHPSARAKPKSSHHLHHHFSAACDSSGQGDNIIFNDAPPSKVKPTLYDLHCHVNACLYTAYSYAGIEISYPQRPFNIAEAPRSPTPSTNTSDFWMRALEITLSLSDKMLRLNSDPLYFARTFAELKGHGVTSVATNTNVTTPTPNRAQAHTTSATVHSPTLPVVCDTRRSSSIQIPSDSNNKQLSVTTKLASTGTTYLLMKSAPNFGSGGGGGGNRNGSSNNSRSAHRHYPSSSAMSNQFLTSTAHWLTSNYARGQRGVSTAKTYRSATAFANISNNTCRSKVLSTGVLGRDRIGEHYLTLFI